MGCIPDFLVLLSPLKFRKCFAPLDLSTQSASLEGIINFVYSPYIIHYPPFLTAKVHILVLDTLSLIKDSRPEAEAGGSFRSKLEFSRPIMLNPIIITSAVGILSLIVLLFSKNARKTLPSEKRSSKHVMTFYAAFIANFVLW